MSTLEKIGGGYDCSGFADKKARELLNSDNAQGFKYFITFSKTTNPGMIGGSFHWSVHATNNISDLFGHLNDQFATFNKRNDGGEIIEISKTDLADQKMEQMSEVEIAEIVKTLIRDRVLGKI